MSTSTYKVSLNIGGDSRDAVTAVDKLDDSIERLDKSTKDATGSNKKLSSAGSGVAKSLTEGSSAAVSSISSLVRLGGAALATGTALAGIGFVTVGVAAIKSGAGVAKLSDELNISTEALTGWQYAAGKVFEDGNKMADVFKDMNDRVGDFASTGGGPLADVMRVTNLEIRDLINLSPDQQLLKVYDALEQIDGLSQSEKTFYLEALAGDASKLIPLLENDAEKLRELTAEAEILGLVINDLDAQKMAIVNAEMGKIGGIAKGAGNDIANALAPALFGITTEISDMVLGMGGFGDVAQDVVDATLGGVGYLANGYQRVEKVIKLIELGALALGVAGSGALASMGERGASLINVVLSPLQFVIGNITKLWGKLLAGAASLGGSLNPFAEDMSAASDKMLEWSESISSFSVSAADLKSVNDNLKGQFADTKAELIALNAEPAYSEKIKAWYAKSEKSLQDQAVAALALKSANVQTGRATHQLGKDIEETSSKGQDGFKKLQDEGVNALQGIRSKLEVFNDTKSRYKVLLDATAISEADYTRLVSAATTEYNKNSQATKDREASQKKFKVLQDEGATALKGIRSKLEVFNDTKARYKVLLDATAISQDDYNQLIAAATGEYTKNSDAVVRANKVNKSFSDIIINDMKGSITELVDTGVPLLDKLITKFIDLAFESDFMSNLFVGSDQSSGGGIGGFVTSLFSGGSGGGSGGGSTASTIGGYLASLFHTGGVPGVDSGSGTKALGMINPRSLPKYHGGGMPGLERNEQVIVVENDEGVFTSGQMAAMAPIAPIAQAINNLQSVNNQAASYSFAPEINVQQQSGADDSVLIDSLNKLMDEKFKEFSRFVMPTRMTEVAMQGGEFSRAVGVRS